jgi:hypothetical protein
MVETPLPKWADLLSSRSSLPKHNILGGINDERYDHGFILLKP